MRSKLPCFIPCNPFLDILGLQFPGQTLNIPAFCLLSHNDWSGSNTSGAIIQTNCQAIPRMGLIIARWFPCFHEILAINSAAAAVWHICFLTHEKKWGPWLVRLNNSLHWTNKTTPYTCWLYHGGYICACTCMQSSDISWLYCSQSIEIDKLTLIRMHANCLPRWGSDQGISIDGQDWTLVGAPHEYPCSLCIQVRLGTFGRGVCMGIKKGCISAALEVQRWSPVAPLVLRV